MRLMTIFTFYLYRFQHGIIVDTITVHFIRSVAVRTRQILLVVYISVSTNGFM
jgi:hypothetical protein